MSPTLNHPMKLHGDSPFEEPPMQDVGFALSWRLAALLAFAIAMCVVAIGLLVTITVS